MSGCSRSRATLATLVAMAAVPLASCSDTPAPAPPSDAPAPAPSDAPPPLFSSVEGPPAELRGVSRGAAWGDFDGDGDPDLFVARPDPEAETAQTVLYRNDGGSLVPLPPEAAPLDAGTWEGAAWVDLDRDGDLDLTVVARRGTGAAALENTGEGRLEPRADPFNGVVISASMTCWADVDGDGWLDVFAPGYRDDTNRLLRGVGAWQFEEIALPAEAQGDGSARACLWVDLDADRLPELVIANARQPNQILRNHGGFDMRLDRSTPLSEDIAYGYGLSTTDVDDDGHPDVLVANYDDDNVLLRNSGDGRLERTTIGSQLESAASKGHTWADFNLDGRIDLYVGSGTPGPAMLNRLYLGEGNGAFRLEDAGVLSTHDDISAAVAAADIDNDGDVDVFVANWDGPDAIDRLYRNETVGGSWLKVRLDGVASNRFGIGARVSVEWTEGDQTHRSHRWVTASTGYAGQDDTQLHFGLSNAPRVDELVVMWPSGQVDRYAEIDARQTITLREGAGS